MSRPKLRSLDIGIYKGISIILIINIIIFFQCFRWSEFKEDPLKISLNEDIREEYGYKPSEINNGEKIYTILTHLFFHDDLLHFLGNMVALFLMGGMIEKRLGTKRFFALYFISGLVAVMVCSIMYPLYGDDPSENSIIGSGASIYGIVAAACIWRPKAKIKWPLTSFIAALIIFPFAKLFEYLIPKITDYMNAYLSQRALNLTIFLFTAIFIIGVLYILYKTVKVQTWVFSAIFITYSVISIVIYGGSLVLIVLTSQLVGFFTGLVLYPFIAKLEKKRRKITTI